MKFDIEKIIRIYNLPDKCIEYIRFHCWELDKYIISSGNQIYCSKCLVDLDKVLYRQQDPDGTKWAELTCNEIIIKKLLE
jgi:hypothetical protein